MKKCSHSNYDCILVMNCNDTLYFGNSGVVIAAMFGNGLRISIVREVPLFEGQMKVCFKQLEQFCCLEILGVQIAERFVGANRLNERGRMNGRETEFVFDGLRATFVIGLGRDT